MDEQAERVLQECHVDDTTQLKMKDLPYVRAALINVSAEWYNLGVHFRIHVNILDQIKRENRSDCDRCLTAMIAEWLKSSPTRVDSPTWKKVVAAIASRVGGDNPSEARKIAKDYSHAVEVPTLSENVDDTLLTLENHLNPVCLVLMHGVAHKWIEIGLLLGIPYSKLKMLEYSDGLNEMVQGVVRAWLEEKYNTQVFGRPSWRKLVEVVGARAGGSHAALAQEIAREHSATAANAQTSQKTVTSAVEAPGSPPTVTNTSTAAQQSNVVDEGPPLGVGALVDVSEYLICLNKDQILQLALVLGLHAVPTLDKIRDTPNFLNDMLAAWLRGQDDVNKRGGHTWGALVKALRNPLVNQNEIAGKIQKEKCHTH